MNKVKEFPNIKNCNPSKCISAKMMKCNRLVANVFRKHLIPFNITNSQLSILFVITKVTGLNQKKIADLLFLEKSTVNRNLKRLFDHHYISYSENSFLTITHEGKEFLEKVIPYWDKAMDEIREILNVDGENALDLLSLRLSG
jgi:DNA-binding MarR family transcriptional regulator